MSERVEILRHFYCTDRKRHVEEWIPGVLIARHSDGRCYVRADRGWVARDAAPECVRPASRNEISHATPRPQN
jgi:hypothetical protein